jgi:hypothetical protein
VKFEKGHTKLAGKKKGTPNRTTTQAKEFLMSVMFGQLDNVNAMFEKLKKDPAKYLDAYSKMFGYVMPKQTDITSGGDKLIPNMPSIIIKTKNAVD